jgi:Protein of unknown function (DUF1282).
LYPCLEDIFWRHTP